MVKLALPSTKNIELVLLRSFVQVADCGSFTLAGQRSHKTQSTISVQIRTLEERLGHQLIERSSRILQLTEQGELLLGYARQMLRIHDEAVARLTLSGQRQQVRVGLVEYMAPHRLPGIVASLPGAFPLLDVLVKIDLSSRLRQDLADGKLDVVIAARKPDEQVGRLLFHESLVWVTCDKALALQRPLPMAFLPSPCFYRDAACAAMNELALPWVCKVTTMNVAGVQAAVSAGLTLGVLGRTSVMPGMHRLGEAEGFPALPGFAVAVFASDKDKMTPHTQLIDFLVNAVSVPTAPRSGRKRA